MLTYQQILKYHTAGQDEKTCGFEYEVFCLDKNKQRLFFYNGKEISGLRKIFDYLVYEKGFKTSPFGKTVGFEKDGVRFTLEPGSQLEYSACRSGNAQSLVKQFLNLLQTYRVLSEKFGINFSDVSLFPIGDVNSVPLLPVDRYQIMDTYFQGTGALGRIMMRDTTSLQLTFNFNSKNDLEEKVNRLLFLKPLLLALSSHSHVYNDKTQKYRSFREMVWRDTDPKRCGDPGNDFWAKGRWAIEDYIEKVLDAPTIFDVLNREYKVLHGELPFRSFLNNANLDSYIFHNSTIFTDIRIKDYIEMRYLDNPSVLLVPGIILLLEGILSDDKIWKTLSSLPYKFHEVPEITDKLNMLSQESRDFWNDEIKPIFVNVLHLTKELYPEEVHLFFDPLFEKINVIGNVEVKEVNIKRVLEDSADRFNNSLAILLATIK